MLCFGLLPECADRFSQSLVNDTDHDRIRNLCGQVGQCRYQRVWEAEPVMEMCLTIQESKGQFSKLIE